MHLLLVELARELCDIIGTVGDLTAVSTLDTISTLSLVQTTDHGRVEMGRIDSLYDDAEVDPTEEMKARKSNGLVQL